MELSQEEGKHPLVSVTTRCSWVLMRATEVMAAKGTPGDHHRGVADDGTLAFSMISGDRRPIVSGGASKAHFDV